MAYKKMALRKRQTTCEFTVGRTRTIRQRNGVVATRTSAETVVDDMPRDVVIFANGRRAETIAPVLTVGRRVVLEGKFSQHNTFVAFGLAATG